MLAVTVPSDFWSIVLTFGIIAMLATTVVTVVGKGATKGLGRAARPGTADGRAELVSPLRASAASAARERASAAARAKAEAARTRPMQLTDVREIPAGHTAARVDGRTAQQPTVSAEEAEAIIAHYAEHEPTRLAEVIIQWIRSDVKNEAPPR